MHLSAGMHTVTLILASDRKTGLCSCPLHGIKHIQDYFIGPGRWKMSAGTALHCDLVGSLKAANALMSKREKCKGKKPKEERERERLVARTNLYYVWKRFRFA